MIFLAMKLVSMNRLWNGCERVAADFACLSPSRTTQKMINKIEVQHINSHQFQLIKTKFMKENFLNKANAHSYGPIFNLYQMKI